MHYPILIESGGKTTAFGVAIPDLPGCFSAGDTLDEAMRNAEEAAAAWIDAALDAGEAIPPASSLDEAAVRPEYRGWSVGLISLSPALWDDAVERVNVSLPRRVLKRLDAQAAAAGETRSGYIAKLSLNRPENGAA